MPETMGHSGKGSEVKKALFYFVSSVAPTTSLKRLGGGEKALFWAFNLEEA